MTVVVRHITIDAKNAYELATFWSFLTGYPIHEDDKPGEPEIGIVMPDPLPMLLFIEVPEAKTVKNRVHLDIAPTDRARDEEVDRLIEGGATLVADHRLPDGRGWVLLADPEGNEFCVERSDSERADAAALAEGSA